MVNIFLKSAPEIDTDIAKRMAGIRKRKKYHRRSLQKGRE